MNELEKRTLQKTLELLTQRLLVMLSQLERYSKPNLLFYNHCKGQLGNKVAKVEKELGCAEAVNNIVRSFTGDYVGGGASSYLFYKAIKKDDRFIQVSKPVAGDIVISPTGYAKYRRIKNGHLGVVSDGEKIMSNNSKTGLWDEHISMSLWKYRYGRVGGYPILYFRLLT